MSSVSINNATRTVEVISTGSQGPIGVNWRDDWALATDYSPRDGVYRNGSSYRATVQHTSSAATEPGVGANWATVWTLLALGSDVESVEAVAAIAAQIVTTASISAEIQTVATYSAQVVTVAADIDSVVAVAPSIASVVAVAGGLGAIEAVASDLENIGLVAADLANIDIAALNIGAILAAPQAAADAQTYAGQAADSAAAAIVAKITWKGAYSGATAYVRSDAVLHNGSAWIARGATTGNAPPSLPTTSNTWWDLLAQKGDVYETYGVSIYKSDGIALGGYYAERSASAASTQTKLYAEIIAGDEGAEVDFYVDVDGSIAIGLQTVTLGMPVDLTALSLAVGAGAAVSFVITSMTGNVTDFFAKTYGAVA